ncbi:MAG: hypothetical protein ABH969_05850 [Pseudomonadota bacterium]
MAGEKSWFKSYAPGVPHEIAFEEVTMPEALRRSAENFLIKHETGKKQRAGIIKRARKKLGGVAL